jgi:polyferredoxin
VTAAIVQRALVVGYVLAVALVLRWEHGPRVVWTVLIAALPFVFVVGGFHLWRRLCPLSWFSQIPVMLGRGGARKIEGRLARHPLVLPMVLMLAALSLRLLAANGTPAALALLLGGAAAAALVTGAVFRGKSWCNYVCPVGVVERIYTEPSRLLGSANSQCATCSACTPRCPDIDVEQGYWKAADARTRRAVWFAWPGVVLGFYVHYRLQAGDWSWYFDGAWAYEVDQASKVMQAGYAFAGLPRLVAAPLTLLLFGGLSFGLFSSGEGVLLLRQSDDAGRDRVRHRALALAGFAAFNAFYAFAGQPTLRLAPGWVRWAVALAVVAASTLLLVRRWTRDEAGFVQDRFAKKLAKRWTWDAGAADRTSTELVVIHSERTRARQERLDAYEATLRELAQEGTVTRESLALLGTVRATLGITDAEHAAIVARLEADQRDLFDPDRAVDRAATLQRTQYRAEVERLVAAAADASVELDDAAMARIRQARGVPLELHEEVLAELLRPETALAGRVAAEAARLVELGAVAETADPLVASDVAALLVRACDHAGRPVAESLRGILLAARDARLEDALTSPDPVARAASARALLDADAPRPSIEDAAADPDRWVAIAAAELIERVGRARPPGAPPRPATLPTVLRLGAAELFAGLPPADLAEVAALARDRSLAPGDELCRQGERGDDVFLVTDGELQARVDGAPVGTFGPGQALGELAVLSPAPRAATVVAVAPSAVLVLAGPLFRDLLRDHPRVAEGMLRQLARRLQTARPAFSPPTAGPGAPPAG